MIWTQEKRMVAVPAVGFILALSWAGWRAAQLPAIPLVQIGAESAAYQPGDLEFPVPQKLSWEQPISQTRGREWMFDLFTPPEIYFNPDSGHFSVIPPSLAARAPQPSEQIFGVELVRVWREPYRLQLVGFVGRGANAVGTFENTSTTEHFLARAGRTLDALDLTIRAFAVHRRQPDAEDAATRGELVATATVLDRRTDKEEVLSTHERNPCGEAVATLVVDGAEAEELDLREGESIEVGSASYTLKSICLAPAGVVIAKSSIEGGTMETRTLYQRSAADAERQNDGAVTR